MFAGASFVGIVARILGWNELVTHPVVIGGIAGALVDSLLGAIVQSRRWCDQCNSETERLTHRCGTATRPHRGIAWLDNDVVNFLSAVAGGAIALLVVVLRAQRASLL
jgi:uncharacterized membrane protein